MDVLLSLPILSYFLAPTMTSWSTSLNLLFFYMTWTTLVLSHSPLRIEVVGLLVIRLLLYLAPSLLSLLLDTLVPSLAEGIKFGGAAALPPRDVPRLARTLALVLANLALEAGVQAGVSASFPLLLPGGGPLLQASTTLPLPWAVARHVGLMLGAREALGYGIHRYVLHGTGRAARWHAQHGAHARRAAPPYALLLCADHPVAFLLHRFAPLYLPALAVRPHLLTFLLFAALATAEETVAMSGYSAVPGLLVGGVARRTAIHYSRGGRAAARGNYGPWGLLDWACATSLGGDVVADVRGEAEKHSVKERSAGMLQNGVDGLRRSQRTRRSRRID